MSNKMDSIVKSLKRFNKDKKVSSYAEDVINAIGKLLDSLDDAISKRK